ncbi:hypothetical protein QYM36_018734 [Artemia franciscana]|uniref:Cysteine--tRNA ligase, cytoplasmic n=1 Tax=Artemia franciscana TaxID=6661 RepID=A0AA88KUB8_ARTSF|nr:hypothetical protein QYM36_018734 [Artemia franciscana]
MMEHTKFCENFNILKSILRQKPEDVNVDYQPFTVEDKTLIATFRRKKEAVHTALCDNINTRSAIDTMQELVSDVYIYLEKQKVPNREVLKNITVFITHMFQVLAVIPKDEFIGFPTETSSATIESPEILIKERDVKRAEEEKKRQEKERKKAEAAAKETEKAALQAIPPGDLFRKETDKYSQFDDHGLLTHDAEGKEISKGLKKKLLKKYESQANVYQDYLHSKAKGNT